MWFSDSDLAKVRSAGVTVSRIELSWSDVESALGTWKWSSYDSMFTKAAQHDITILPVLMDTPGWVGASSNVIPSDASTYGQFAAAAAARYGPGGTFWKANPSLPYRPAQYFELLNEPYWYLYNDNGADPGTYARLVKAAAQAGKAANPQAKFLLEADTTGYETSTRQVEWVDAMYSAVPDLNSWFDGVAVHPYSQPRGPDVYTPGSDRWQFRRIQDIHQKFSNHGGGDKPFWLTEIGWPTCPSDSSKCVSESVQASYTQRMIDILKSEYANFVQGVVLYNYHDPATQNPTNMENWFGVLRGDGSPKPAWTVLQQATGAA